MADVSFTSTAEMNAFEIDEKGVNLAGFVTSVTSLLPIDKRPYHVFKFVLSNNDGTKIKCIIWGTAMGRKWKDEIKINSIVELLGGNIRPAVPRWRDADCLPIDFHVQSHTDIILHGFHVPDLGVIQDEDVQRVPFDSLLDETGVIEIVGFIRNKFRIVQTEQNTYGQAQVCDGFYRLTINVANYIENSTLIAGTPVLLKGKMSNMHFQMNNMSDITIRDDVFMSKIALDSSFNPISRKRPQAAPVVELPASTSAVQPPITSKASPPPPLAQASAVPPPVPSKAPVQPPAQAPKSISVVQPPVPLEASHVQQQPPPPPTQAPASISAVQPPVPSEASHVQQQPPPPPTQAPASISAVQPLPLPTQAQVSPPVQVFNSQKKKYKREHKYNYEKHVTSSPVNVNNAKRARKYEKPAQAEPEDDAESAISISDESVMSPCSISESDTD